MNKLLKNISLLFLLLCSSLVFGQIELKQKALDQALKDLETSKKQASLLLNEKLKDYDLNRLPPHYKKMLEEKLYGAAQTTESMSKLRAKYEKIISAAIKSTASGKGGDLAKLNSSFQNAIKGKLSPSVIKIPNKTAQSISKAPKKNVTKTKSKNFKYLKTDRAELVANLEKSSAEVQLKQNRFVKDNNDLLSKNKVNSIFDRHSQVYLNEIYKKLK